jgi:hypothetical protein
MNEIVQGVKVMKFQSWEEQFLARIIEARAEEAKFLLYYHICRGLTLPVTWCLPIIACMLNLIAYSLLNDGNLPSPPDTFALVAFYKLAGTKSSKRLIVQ